MKDIEQSFAGRVASAIREVEAANEKEIEQFNRLLAEAPTIESTAQREDNKVIYLQSADKPAVSGWAMGGLSPAEKRQAEEIGEIFVRMLEDRRR